jgi:hypothetical protein
MSRARILNPADIVYHKKDFFWDKDYFGFFHRGELIDYILYSQCYHSKYLIELHHIENRNIEFVKEFLHYFSRRQTRYFIRELDEKNNIEDIQFMNHVGFQRFNRNFCFEYSSSLGLSDNYIFCRDANLEDLDKIIELDIAAQILDYRDTLHKTKKFLRERLADLFVFVNSREDLDHILAFAIKKPGAHNNTFEFIIHPNISDISFGCIESFAEKHIRFEKNLSFRFTVNENQKSIMEDLKRGFELIWSSQLLIYEGAPREHAAQLHTAFNVAKTAVS